LTLLALAAPALAADFSYNYIEAGYQEIDIDDDLLGGFDVDGDGFGVGGSFEINDNWFIGASYSKADFDFGVDLTQLSLGAGYHVPLTNGSDFYGSLAFVRAEVSASGFGSVDDDGYAAEIGVRGMIGDRFELNGSLGYVDLGDGGDGTSFGAGVLYSFTDSVAAGLSLDVDEDITAYGIGIRIYFDK
jgi:long-subunit fatty acid transport protein